MQFVAVVGDDAHVRRGDGIRRDAEQLRARVCYDRHGQRELLLENEVNETVAEGLDDGG